jgi:hypothetical protein
VDSLPRDPVSNYDKASLIGDLKLAGFEDSIAEIIASRVDEHKAKGWTYDMGRQEALREAQELIKNSHMALDAFRASTLPETGKQRERPYAERIADSTIT